MIHLALETPPPPLRQNIYVPLGGRIPPLVMERFASLDDEFADQTSRGAHGDAEEAGNTRDTEDTEDTDETQVAEATSANGSSRWTDRTTHARVHPPANSTGEPVLFATAGIRTSPRETDTRGRVQHGVGLPDTANNLTADTVVIGAPLRLARGMNRCDPPEINFGTEAINMPRACDPVDVNDRLFVTVSHARETNAGDRVGTWMSTTLQRLGIVSEPQTASNLRLRIHAGDLYVPVEERTAYRLLVEGGRDLKYRLVSSGIGMHAIVGCGVSLMVGRVWSSLCATVCFRVMNAPAVSRGRFSPSPSPFPLVSY
jgi:hypothetical protein